MIYLTDLLESEGILKFPNGLPERFPRFVFDSRRVREGDLFVAQQTDRGDGHEFIEDALSGGAAAVLCKHWNGAPDRIILSKDPLKTVQHYASLVIRQFGPTVIAITGSVGKTSTREFAAHVIGEQYDVFRNPENYNDSVGLPLAIGELDPGHEIAILEMASDSHGEIEKLTNLAPPSICVLTRFDETYLDCFGTMEELAKEHKSVIDALPSNGTVIYPTDDRIATSLASTFDGTKVSYGLESNATVQADKLAVDIAATHFQLRVAGTVLPVELPVPGIHNVKNALAAAGLGIVLGMDITQIVNRLSCLEPIAGRFRLLQSKTRGLIFDDTFVDGPASLEVALKYFEQTSLQPIAVIGALRQIGTSEPEVMTRLGPLLARNLHTLICYGDDSKQLGLAAQTAGLAKEQIREAHTIVQAEDIVKSLDSDRRPLFIKGNSNDRLERLVEPMLSQQSDAKVLLCRQSPVWQQIVTLNPDAPVWIQIDLDAIRENTKSLLDIVGPQVALLAVLKAEGYGHGALKVANTAMHAGAAGVAVARLDEARSLREAGFTDSILVLGATAPAESRQAALTDCELTVFDHRGIDALVRATNATQRTTGVHLKIETGMNRLGASVEDAAELAQKIVEAKWLQLEGTFTHLGQAHMQDKSDATAQLDRFDRALATIKRAGISPGLVHAANSAATLTIPRSHYDAVRCGIALLGLEPAETVSLAPEFKPALAMKARIAQVKHLPANSYVGYGTSGFTPKETRIAVVTAGYGDGIRRGPQNAGAVMVRKELAPILGDICMDMFMIDVSAIPAARSGDEVILLGGNPKSPVSVENIAKHTGTIAYEVISQLLPRIPRV